MNKKRIVAALLALCLMLCGALGALAEQEKPDVVEDLLRYFLGIEDESAGAPPEADVGAPADGEAGAYIEEETDVEAVDGADGEEEYVFDYDPAEEEEIVVEEPIVVNDLSINESLPADWLNILLLGTDSRGSTKYLRTDTMIVLSVNQEKGEAKMTSIMRDTWIQIPGYEGQKLNAACVYGGPELTMRMINEYFGLNLEYYALVNMKCLVQLVDSLGGIRLDITRAEAGAMNRLIASDAESGDSNRNFATSKVHSGTQVLLNGKQALAFSRIRKQDSDYARTERQRTVLLTIARGMQGKSLISLAGIVTGMLQYVETNLSFDEIMTIVNVCMKLDLNNLQQFRVPADGTYQDGMNGGTWRIDADFEANKALLYDFIYGD